MFLTRKIHRYFLGGYWKSTFSMESRGFNYLSMIYINRVSHVCGRKFRFTFCVILFRDTNRIITSLLTSPHLFRITCRILGHNWSHIKVPIFWIQLLQVGAWMSDNMLMYYAWYLMQCFVVYLSISMLKTPGKFALSTAVHVRISDNQQYFCPAFSFWHFFTQIVALRVISSQYL